MATAVRIELVKAQQVQALLTALLRVEADRLAMMDAINDRKRALYAEARAIGVDKVELRQLVKSAGHVSDGPRRSVHKTSRDPELFAIFEAICRDHPILQGRTSPKTYSQYVRERKAPQTTVPPAGTTGQIDETLT